MARVTYKGFNLPDGAEVPNVPADLQTLVDGIYVPFDAGIMRVVRETSGTADNGTASTTELVIPSVSHAFTVEAGWNYYCRVCARLSLNTAAATGIIASHLTTVGGTQYNQFETGAQSSAGVAVYMDAMGPMIGLPLGAVTIVFGLRSSTGNITLTGAATRPWMFQILKRRGIATSGPG